jgi:hypothetical protein
MLEFFAARKFNRIDMIAILILALVGEHDGVVYGVAGWFIATIVSVTAELNYERATISKGDPT